MITLNEVASWLDGLDISYSQKEDRIIFGVSDEGNRAGIFVRAKDDGRIFELQMEPLDDNGDALDPDKDHQHLGVLLPQLLYYNYETKFGTWEFDPSDGDIRFAIEIPLEDAKMTETQFKRIMSMVSTNLDNVGKIKEILATGKVAASDDESMDELFEIFKEYLHEKSAIQDGI